MKKLLTLAAVGEAATGLVLLVYPPIVIWLLFGAEISGIGVAMSRIAGISLIALGLACWPGSDTFNGASRGLRGMVCYGLLVMLYLAYLGVRGREVGILLWPAVVVHVTLTFLLARAWFKDQQKGAK